MKLKHLILLSVICCSQSVFGQKANQQPKTSGNPVFPGWYADPEGVVFGDEYWIYPTYSAPYDEQTFMDAFSSKDLYFTSALYGLYSIIAIFGYFKWKKLMSVQ